MGNFFKKFGLGVLYVFVLPVVTVILALYAVLALFIFLFLGIKGIILFFQGRSLFDDLPEDKKAKEILAAQAQAATPVINTPVNQNNEMNFYTSTPNMYTEIPDNSNKEGGEQS